MRMRRLIPAMEADPSLLLELVLSPPYLTWLSRDESPSHLSLLAVWGGHGSLAGWLPWTARAALLSAGVLVAGSLLYWRLKGRGGEDVSDEETDSPVRKRRQLNVRDP